MITTTVAATTVAATTVAATTVAATTAADRGRARPSAASACLRRFTAARWRACR
ncbi:hypothetical protein OHJ16_15835 [Actinomyces israelii]|uniref:Secreted peptide n=1 Tax=Actinomyces israelii TaxID=1659 RepID=A0ABT4IEF5_9ACTO|nr:hypothetical protein [Actinomyces israelii]MCZ0859503.1 hypothetical protein [Actinomyces israelii]